MIPTNSSNNLSTGCDPISSNCVIWQGPDLPCINLCNGDTISDVIALLAQELCDIIDAACTCDPDIKEVVQGCLVEPGSDPFPTLDELLSAMIAYMCDPNNFPNNEWVTTYVALECLDYEHPPGSGQMQGTLSVEEYLKLLAGKVCGLLDDIKFTNQQIQLIWQHINILEGYFPIVHPDIMITLSCDAFKSYVMSRNPTVITIQQWAVAMEHAWCELRANVGTPADVQTAVASACILGNQAMLANLGDYGEPTTGPWFSPVTNLAQGQTNIWKVLCDMYLAVSDMQANCCDTGCENVEFGYVTSMVYDPGGLVTHINFNFTPTFVPAGLYDCGNGATITVNDGVKPKITDTVFVYPLQNSAGGFDFDVTSLTQSASYNVKVEFCFISQDGSQESCSAIISQEVTNSLACPNPISLTPTDTTILFSFTNTLGPNVDYDVYLTSLGAPVSNMGFPNPQPAGVITGTFGTSTPLSPGTQYGVYVIITPPGGGPPTTCATEFTTTTTPACVDVQDTGPYPTTAISLSLTLGISEQTAGNFHQAWVEEDSLGVVSINLEPAMAAPPTCSTDPAIPCIDGTNLEVVEFTCGVTTYTAPVGSGWYFHDSYTNANGIVYYVYGAWEIIDPEFGTAELTDVVFCCECPVWLIDQFLTMEAGHAVTFTLASVSFGTPVTFTVISGPYHGNVTQPTPGVFEYVNTYTPKNQQDQFVVQIDTPCGSTTATCGVLLISGGKALTTGTKFFVFIDTTTITDPVVGAQIVATMDAVMAAADINCPVFGGVPEMYILPTTTSDFIECYKAMVDRNAAGILSAVPAWAPLTRVPTDWAAGIEVPIDDTYVVFFQNNASTSYHPATLVTGLTTQPTLNFANQVEDLRAALTGGTIPTPWWSGLTASQQLPQFGVGFRTLVLPAVLGTVNDASAFALFLYALLYGTNVPDTVWDARPTGNTNLKGYLNDSVVFTPNPYDGFICPLGNVMQSWMLDPAMEFFINLNMVDDGSGFDYSTTEFEEYLYNALITQTCPTTALWELTPCPAFAASPIVYTYTDLSPYEVGSKSINVLGVCYTVNQVIPSAAYAPVPVTVIADAWFGSTACVSCSNFLMTSCDDPAITHITAVNLSAHVTTGNAVQCIGTGPVVNGCFTITTTNSAPTHSGTMVVAADCEICIDCIATELGVNLAILNIDLQSSDVWSDNGVTPAVDLGIIGRVDSLNGTCGVPTVPVLGNALNLSASNEYVYEVDGIVGKGADALTGGAIGVSYLTVANDAAIDTMPNTIYIAFAPSAGAGAQDHVISYTSTSAMNDGWGIICDGTNFKVWSNAEGTGAYNLTTVGTVVVDDIFILGLKVEAAGITLKEEGLVPQTAVVPWIAPTTDITFGGTPDAAGAWPGLHQAPGRLFNVMLFDEAHSDVEMQTIIETMRAKFGT